MLQMKKSGRCFCICQRERNWEIPALRSLKIQEFFPDYVIRMAKLGQETGTLDQMMKSLSDYYEKEDRLIKTLKNVSKVSGYDDPYAVSGTVLCCL